MGDVEEGDDGQKQYYVWTHKKFDIGYNGGGCEQYQKMLYLNERCRI